MKKLLSIFTVIFAIVMLQSCKQESPVDYNNSIITQQQAIVYKIDNLKKAIDKYSYIPADEAIKGMNASYDSLMFQIDSGLNFISHLEDFNGDNSLKDAANTLFTSYKSIVEGDYKQVIELYKIPDQYFKPQDQQELDSLLVTSNKKLEDALNAFIEVHTQFADKNNLTIEN